LKNPPDFITAPEPGRSPVEIREHYELEKTLAARLRDSTRDERRTLYPLLYDELFDRVTSHPMLASPGASVAAQLKLIDRYLHRDTVFLEIGAGDCRLSLAVADQVRHVYALEVSQTIASRVQPHQNLEVLITEGINIPIPSDSVTLAYSNQVLEHLHPDDVSEHFWNINDALTPGGRYVCLTPNRLVGPHDVSKYFDETPTGFHLREYTVGEVASLMRTTGFRKVEAWTTRKGLSGRVPWPIVRAVEATLNRLPRSKRQRIGRALPARVVVGSYVVAIK
jgi:SAM-dependent methyltransferase